MKKLLFIIIVKKMMMNKFEARFENIIIFEEKTPHFTA